MKSTKCAQCGFVSWSYVETCRSCGAPLSQGSYASESRNHAEGQEKGLAIAALVLGIVSFFTFGLLGVGAIVGIVVAVKAMGRVSREPYRYGGRSLAIAGLVLCISSLASTLPIGVIAAIAIPNLLASRRAANEASALHSLRTITASEYTFQSKFGRYGTLEELRIAGLIDRGLASGKKNGYRFALTFDLEHPEVFELTSIPMSYGSSGTRSFYVDETFVIRGADNSGGPSTKLDPPLGTGSDSMSTFERRPEYDLQPAN